MATTVFIDGAAGTTGLDIAERLSGRDDLSLLILGEDERKHDAARREAFYAADFAILCLPDEAAREAVTLATGSAVRIIDASSAHRVTPGWVFGFAEMAAGQRDAIAACFYRENDPQLEGRWINRWYISRKNTTGVLRRIGCVCISEG